MSTGLFVFPSADSFAGGVYRPWFSAAAILAGNSPIVTDGSTYDLLKIADCDFHLPTCYRSAFATQARAGFALSIPRKNHMIVGNG
jgi:hypothetical protein